MRGALKKKFLSLHSAEKKKPSRAAKAHQAFGVRISGSGGVAFGVRQFSFCLEPVVELVAFFTASRFVELVGATANVVLQSGRIERRDWFGAFLALHLYLHTL